MRRKLLTLAAVVAAAGTLGIGGATSAAAAPPPSIPYLSSDIVPVPAGPCNGNIHVDLDQRADGVHMILTPMGTYGTAACPVFLQLSVQTGWRSHGDLFLMASPLDLPLGTSPGFSTMSILAAAPVISFPAAYYFIA